MRDGRTDGWDGKEEHSQLARSPSFRGFLFSGLVREWRNWIGVCRVIFVELFSFITFRDAQIVIVPCFYAS
jgi:hypothetical protein